MDQMYQMGKSFEEWIIIQMGKSLQKTLGSYYQIPEGKILF